MNTQAAQMPGYWRFLWMFFMQPISLHYLLMECGIAEVNMSLRRWWLERMGLSSNYGVLIKRLIFSSVIVNATWIFILILSSKIFNFHIDFFWFFIAVLIGIVSGYFYGFGWGMMSLFYDGVTSGVVLGFFFGVDGRLSTTIFAVTIGCVLGIFLFSSIYVVKFMKFSFLNIDSKLAIIAFGVAFGMILTMVAYVKLKFGDCIIIFQFFLISYLISVFRIPIYLFETFLVVTLYIFSGKNPEQTLRYNPVLFNNLSYFPYFFLTKHIVSSAKNNPSLALRVIQMASIAPGQKRNASNAVAELAAIEVTRLIQEKDYANLVDVKGAWLPGKQNNSPILQTFSSLASYLQAAVHASSPQVALQHLQFAEQNLHGLENQLLTSKELIARFLPDTLKILREQIASNRIQAKKDAEKVLPNPFSSGNPIALENPWGNSIFRGREDTVRQLESLLAEQHNTHSLALIGPRRCGKSSLLNMLRELLPDTVVVLFDLQAHPANTPAAFYAALAETAQQQAWHDRKLSLPALPTGEPIEALKQWLHALENLSDAPRILICIDEFERLETLFPEQGGGRDLLQLMGLFRATIQHCRRVRLLVAGAAPFDEMGRIWNDHFINLRQLNIGNFDQPTATALLMQPFEEFPVDAIKQQVADAVFARSRGQPFLTQAYGHALIENLNREERKQANLADVALAEECVLQNFNYYFKGIWQDVPPEGQAVLSALAHGATIEISKAMQRWLQKRLFLNQDNQLVVPVFGRWICERDEYA